MVTTLSPRATWLSALLIGAWSAIVPGLAVSAPRADESGHGYYVYADVVEVTPRYGWHETSEPMRRCEYVAAPRERYHHPHTRYHDHRYRRHDHGSDAAAGLVGGLIGGLVGNQFGGGDGRKALTVVGALVGASVATDRVRRERMRRDYRGGSYGYDHEIRRCTETQRTRQVRGVSGYDVSYRYQGRVFHKFVNEHPGDRVRVRVAVEPME